MNLSVKYVSSLEKIINIELMNNSRELSAQKIFKGESYSFQLCVISDAKTLVDVSLSSPIEKHINAYFVKKASCDCTYPHDDDVLFTEPSIVPDILLPIDKQNGRFIVTENDVSAIWIEVCACSDICEGKYPISFTFTSAHDGSTFQTETQVEIVKRALPPQSTTFTQWFYADCIADYHGVPAYCEEHWTLIEKYMKLANKLGINMILTPIITPPLDTLAGIKRTCVQLVKIEKKDKYYFDFSLLDKWIDIALSCGMEYFEMAHLFSQWGLHNTPNIMVTENGKEYYKFNSEVDSRDGEYKIFLTQFLTELVAYLKNKGVYEKCFFHVSDEPFESVLDNYRYGREIVAGVVDEDRMIDALSHAEYFDEGLVKNPVPAINALSPFLERDINKRWCYYCCSQWDKVSNRFLHMPSYRTRIIGLQMYKFGITGFLHWGFNFYNSSVSRYRVNPYQTTSGDLAYPSGDPFTVYPYEDDVIPSLRGLVFKEALQDIELCKSLEKHIGRDEVIKMIDDEAGMNLTFEEYPRSAEYILNITNKMKAKIQECEDEKYD